MAPSTWTMLLSSCTVVSESRTSVVRSMSRASISPAPSVARTSSTALNPASHGSNGRLRRAPVAGMVVVERCKSRVVA